MMKTASYFIFHVIQWKNNVKKTNKHRNMKIKKHFNSILSVLYSFLFFFLNKMDKQVLKTQRERNTPVNNI